MFPEVTKISLGNIVQAKGTQFKMKFFEINGGWSIAIIGSKAVQHLRIYSKNPSATKEKLEEKLVNVKKHTRDLATA